MNTSLEIKVTHKITDERLKDILCTAFESGGCNYWISSVDPGKVKDERVEYFHEKPVYDIPIRITVAVEEDKERYGKNLCP